MKLYIEGDKFLFEQELIDLLNKHIDDWSSGHVSQSRLERFVSFKEN